MRKTNGGCEQQETTVHPQTTLPPNTLSSPSKQKTSATPSPSFPSLIFLRKSTREINALV